MRHLLLAGTALLVLGAAPAVADATSDAAARALVEQPQVCGPAGPVDTVSPVSNMVMVDGFGAATFAVDTTNPEAQAWFNHGVRLRWAFEHSESVRAFRKARELDPTCGMCAWGEAWAMGPNLNGGGGEEEVQKEALTIAREARRLTRRGPAMHRQMIDALIQRYSGREGTRGKRFAQGMDRIARRNPNDVTVAAVTADAWMLQADEWWDDEGKAADRGITRAMTILEQALARVPDDPGTIHLYIHLTEWSDDPHKAIPYGERLALLAPGASHLVHMPSHTFFRVGRYREAMMSNVDAVALDKRYVEIAASPDGVLGKPLHAHNIHFGMGGALMAGGGEQGLFLADWYLSTWPGLVTAPAADEGRMWLYRQFMATDAYAIYGRFGTAEKVASLAQPDAGRSMMLVGWRYARGEAAARRGDAAAVKQEAAAIAALLATGFSGPMADEQKDFAGLFQNVLEGRAAMIDGDFAAAVAAYGRAAEIQAKDDEGGDPPLIWYPTRRSLAAALLASGDAAGARAKVLELLVDWPSDPYSYFVLALAEDALGHADAAAEARRLGQVEWIGGEMTLPLA